ncbi:SRPBCC domain-containing protein [Carboxylicivirga sediminis]|uniref:SRPBCC domain-containing protein n=1 Tax=Carboxylicivirga sediminis TaxID=2006564 RepID=A0A941F6I2_9BACT|nr:SRPBCC domain-containing protein [Carboxylicivirga sediminis]MBR8537427.1 SRPBCC domain-containing protein [Carboxylicivirga sediminis]
MLAITISEVYPVKPETVWNAITQLKQMRQWFFENIPAFKAEIGFTTQFEVDAGERQFIHKWKIVEVIPGQLIKYEWSYEHYRGMGYVTFNIEHEAGQTKLTLVSEGLDSFKPKVPEFTTESCQAGWNYFIKERLQAYLSGSL